MLAAASTMVEQPNDVGWSQCSTETADRIIELLPKLTEILKVNGRVRDGEIEQCMGHLLKFDEDSRNADNCALNHGWCLWTNNDKVVNTYNEKQLLDAQKKFNKDNRANEKEKRLFSPDRAVPVDNHVRPRSDGDP